jgi:hypothetical protein
VAIAGSRPDASRLTVVNAAINSDYSFYPIFFVMSGIAPIRHAAGYWRFGSTGGEP